MASNPVAVAAILAVMNLMTTASYWQVTPDKVPIWWDLQGHPLWWVPRWLGLLLLPVLELAIPYTLYQLVVRDSALKSQGGESKHAVAQLIVLPAQFLFLVDNFTLLTAATSKSHDFGARFFVATVALWLLIWFGHNVQYVEPNSVIGILTPWSLSNSTVWKLSHARAGWWLQSFGVLLLLVAWLVPLGLPLLLVFLFLLILPFVILFIDSYRISVGPGLEPLIESEQKFEEEP